MEIFPKEQPLMVNIILLLLEVLTAILLFSLIIFSILWCVSAIREAYKQLKPSKED